MEIFHLKWIPCVFKSLPLPNLACPNLPLLLISPILLWRHEKHFSGASCSSGSCRQCSTAEIWPKAWHWVICSGAQMPPHYHGWKDPCSECDGHWHHTEPGDVEVLCPHWSGIPRASSSLPTTSKAFLLNPVSISLSFILCVFQYFFCFLQLIWWGVTVRGRARNAEGAGGAKEKADFHHEEQALEDGEEALGAQVPIKMGTSTPGVSADCCLSLKLCIWCCYNTIVSDKKWPAEPGQPVWVQMIKVKMCNLIFSLCNQRTDKVQICSTDTHGQVILPSYIKPNDSLQPGYLLKQTLYPGLLIHVFCQTEIRAAQCHVSTQSWDGASWKKCCIIFRGLWSKDKSATQPLMKVGTTQAAAETP